MYPPKTIIRDNGGGIFSRIGLLILHIAHLIKGDNLHGIAVAQL